MTYRPRNRNERTQEARDHFGGLNDMIDHRKDKQSKPCGFEPQRWGK